MRRLIFSHARPHATALALGLLPTIGCYDNSGNSTRAKPQSPPAPLETKSLLTEEQVQELTALGYLGFTQETVPADEKVVPVYDPELSAPGYNLVILRELATVQLFDAQQLENGNFLIFDNGLKKQSSRVIELNPISRKIVWQFPADGENTFFTIANGSS